MKENVKEANKNALGVLSVLATASIAAGISKIISNEWALLVGGLLALIIWVLLKK